MKSAIALLAIVCVSACRAGDEEECHKPIMALKKAMNEMVDNGSVPQCATDLGLTQFRCTAGEDPEKDEEVAKSMREFMKKLNDDERKEVAKCSSDVFEAAKGNVKEDIPEECVQKMHAMMKMMLAKEED